MPSFRNSLDRVKIAAPCAADWDQMFAFRDERVRFCSHCNQNVYNLSAMSQREANALVYRTEGRLCVRFYRRSDGTVLTQNCPVGLRALKRRVAWAVQAMVGMLLSFFAIVGWSDLRPVRKLEEFITPRPVVMGGIAPPKNIPVIQPEEPQQASLMKDKLTNHRSQAN